MATEVACCSRLVSLRPTVKQKYYYNTNMELIMHDRSSGTHDLAANNNNYHLSLYLTWTFSTCHTESSSLILELSAQKALSIYSSKAYTEFALAHFAGRGEVAWR